jgi:hypothetical protein
MNNYSENPYREPIDNPSPSRENKVHNTTFVVAVILLGIASIIGVVLGAYSLTTKASKKGGTITGTFSYDDNLPTGTVSLDTKVLTDIGYVTHLIGDATNTVEEKVATLKLEVDANAAKFDLKFGGLCVANNNVAMGNAFLIHNGGASQTTYEAGVDFTFGAPEDDKAFVTSSGFFGARWAYTGDKISKIIGFSWQFPSVRSATTLDFDNMFAVEVGGAYSKDTYPLVDTSSPVAPFTSESTPSLVVFTGTDVANDWKGTIMLTTPVSVSANNVLTVHWIGAGEGKGAYTLGGTTVTVHMEN